MALVLYSYNDPGAPASGSNTIAVLDAVLVNGYGSKPPAGWTKEFSAAGMAAYRMPATAPRRLFLRVQTSTTPYYWLGYLNMTAVDTGTGVFPPDLNQNLISTTANNWFVLADDRTVIFITLFSTRNSIHYFGYLRDESPGDINHAICMGSQSTSSGNLCIVGTYFDYSVNPWGGIYFGGLLGPYGTSGDPAAGAYCLLNSPSGVGNLAQGSEQNQNTLPGFPDSAGLYQLQRFAVVEAKDSTTPRVYRGRLRGIAWPSAQQSTMTDGQIIAGTGDYAGVTVQVLKSVYALRANVTSRQISGSFTLCLLIGD